MKSLQTKLAKTLQQLMCLINTLSGESLRTVFAAGTTDPADGTDQNAGVVGRGEKW